MGIVLKLCTNTLPRSLPEFLRALSCKEIMDFAHMKHIFSVFNYHPSTRKQVSESCTCFGNYSENSESLLLLIKIFKILK